MSDAIPLSPTTLAAIIADTPFLSHKTSAKVLGLPDRLAQLGLSTFEEMWTVSPEKLSEALSSVELEIDAGHGKLKRMPLAKIDASAAMRLVKVLLAAKGDKRWAQPKEPLTGKALGAVLG